ncbi:MAG: response regulator [Chromatiales bacterium]|nr:response regulator [Chromatiales bacterium]
MEHIEEGVRSTARGGGPARWLVVAAFGVAIGSAVLGWTMADRASRGGAEATDASLALATEVATRLDRMDRAHFEPLRAAYHLEVAVLDFHRLYERLLVNERGLPPEALIALESSGVTVHSVARAMLANASVVLDDAAAREIASLGRRIEELSIQRPSPNEGEQLATEPAQRLSWLARRARRAAEREFDLALTSAVERSATTVSTLGDIRGQQSMQARAATSALAVSGGGSLVALALMVAAVRLGRRDRRRALEIGPAPARATPPAAEIAVPPATATATATATQTPPDRPRSPAPDLHEDEDETPSAPEIPCVLVADDHPVNREVAREILRLAGLRVGIATDGSEAVDRVRHGDYDLVLMDCQMPVQDGLSATRELRAGDARRRRDGRRLPIVAVTANTLEGDRERCIEAGMDDYVAKPFTAQTLLGTVHEWLGNAADAPSSEAPEPTSEPPAAGDLATAAAPSKDPRCAAAGAGTPADSPARPAAEDDVPVSDPSVLAQIRALEANGAKGLLGRLVTAFVSSAQTDVDAVTAGAAAADLEVVRAASHRLKSSSANVGAMRLSALCREVEARARAGEAAELEVLAAALAAEHEAAVAALQRVAMEAAA